MNCLTLTGMTPSWIAHIIMINHHHDKNQYAFSL
jgi:hypothetical protein